MTRFVSIFSLLLVFASLTQLSAQQQATVGRASNIIDELQRYDFGKGEIIINQSNAIRNLIGKRGQGANVELDNNQPYLVVQGYRTQVFTGNNQRISKEEALRKEKEIKERFPELSTYVTYSAPFWRLRVGDFYSHEEAYHTKLMLSKAFPSYGKEIYIVKEDIRIPLEY